MNNKKSKYLIILFLLIASFVVYGRILSNGFVNFDDEVYLTKNQHVQAGLNGATIKWAFTGIVSSNWHPVTLISHALDWSMFKDHAGSHHLVNLFLHIANTLLLFLLLNRITNNIWPSAFVAALFALHPLRVESVAWASERKDVLSMFFGLVAIYAYVVYAETKKISKYILCLMFFAIGLMAKPMLVTLPFVLMLLDFWPLKRRQEESVPQNISKDNALSSKTKGKKQKSSIKIASTKNIRIKRTGSYFIVEKLPFFALSIVSCIITVWAQNRGGAVASLQKLPFTERVANAIVAYVAYLGKIFWPVDLAVFYPYQHAYPGWQIAGALLILLGLSALAVYSFKQAPFFLVGWLWYLGTLVPVSGLVQVGRQAMADRYTYLPSIGIGIMLAWGITYLLPQNKLRKIVLWPAAIIVLVVLSILTWQQCGYWKNSIELFNHALQVTDKNYLAHTNLGVALAAEGKSEEALKNYNAAIQINPDHDNGHYNLANLLVKQGKIEEAIKHYREAVRINPNYVFALNNLGINLVKMHRDAEAIPYYRRAILIEPNNGGIHANLGAALADTGNMKEAIEEFREAVYLNPDYEDARRALRMALEIEKRQNR